MAPRDTVGPIYLWPLVMVVFLKFPSLLSPPLSWAWSRLPQRRVAGRVAEALVAALSLLRPSFSPLKSRRVWRAGGAVCVCVCSFDLFSLSLLS